MSHINHEITNEQVIPVVESAVFTGHEASKFAVGIIAVGEQAVSGMDEEFMGYLRLRANVYAAQTNMISHDLVNEDGTERDTDDARSVHFAVFENKEDQTRVVGAMRLIIKDAEHPELLPIEEFFTEELADNPAPLGSNEVSRYICRHEDARVQGGLKWLLYTKALGYIMTHDLRPTYAVVEPALEREFAKTGVPAVRIAEPKFVEEYAADNLGMIVDTDGLMQAMGLGSKRAQAKLRATEFNFDYSGVVTKQAAAAEVVA